MVGFLASIGIILIIIGVSVGLLALVSLIFPSTKQIFPEDWKKGLSFQYTAYYLLGGGLCLLISQQL